MENALNSNPTNDSTPELGKKPSSYESPFELAIIPVQRPEGRQPDCTIELMNYEFKNSYYQPYVGPYKPAANCQGKDIEQAVLIWKGFSIGRQYDRFSAVWLDDVEILRTSTAEPTYQGIHWEFELDITRYKSILNNERTVTVSLNNIVDELLTGTFKINLTLELYLKKDNQEVGDIFNRPADRIVGISQFGKSNEPWFVIGNNQPIKFQLPEISKSTRRAKLEVFITGHGTEEYFQFNTPDDFAKDKDLPRFGPLRELHVSVNDIPAGVGWPFPVFYTGGVSPPLWRPISGIGSFSTDPILFELSQFVGDLISTNGSVIQLAVSPSSKFWLVSANLHLWHDEDGDEASGGMISSNSLQFPISPMTHSSYKDKIYDFRMQVARQYIQKGHINQPDGRMKINTGRRLRINHNLQYYKNIDKNVFDFTVTIQTETAFTFYSDELKLQSSTQSSEQPFYESHTQNWRFFGDQFTETYSNKGFKIDANVAAEVSSRHRINSELVSELELSQSAWGVFDRKKPDAAAITDGNSEGSVRYVAGGEESNRCYNREVKTNHGWITKDEKNDECEED